MEELEYKYWFYTLDYLSHRECERLLKEYHCIENIFQLSQGTIEQLPWLSKRAKSSLIHQRNPCRIIERIQYVQEKGMGFVCITDKEYPQRLRYLKDKPKALFYLGELPKEEKYAVAVIGARDCSNYGKRLAEEIGDALAKGGVNVISGMARGIDSYAQKKALDMGGRSYGVLGCGVDVCYPKTNWCLYEQLIEKGGILSEFLPGMPAKAINFPQRNRIISGISDAVVVVEAKRQSGTSITVGYGLEQGKDIYAVPGRVDDSLSEGCNLLISQGAYPVLSIEEMMRDMGIVEEKNLKFHKKMEIPLESRFKLVYDCLDFIPKSVVKLVEETGIDNLEEINQILFDLEIDDRIQQAGTGYYVRR
ncbi:MAG: DNA-processing protein DprA [Lachnospiraceae bacterium]|nr:DNA-processing protein DprA [Lachnospiraceae bacterium]